MAIDDQRLPLARNLGDAFAMVCRYFGHTPAGVSRALGLDKKTARNAIDGKAGVPAITRALQERQKTDDDHYELWMALGEMIFGESHDQYEERKLRALIESTHNAQRLVGARQARRDQIRARAYADVGDVDQRRA